MSSGRSLACFVRRARLALRVLAMFGALASCGVGAGCSTPSATEALPFGARAEDCASCHADHAAEWRTSPHARAAASPVFAAMLPVVESAWGVVARQRCEGCHAPGHGGDEGIGCVSCHAAVGNQAERDGLLDVELAAPLAGPLGQMGIATDAHRSSPRTLLTNESLCGTCHEITGPGLLREPTLSEYRASPEAAAGMTCIDCHAPPVDDRRLTAETPKRRSRSHAFVGFDPPWGAPPADAAAAAAATRELLASALALRIETRPDGTREVVVENVGAGHRVPTGAAFLRDLWVDLELDGAAASAPILRIGDQPTREGRPVALLTDADAVTVGSLGSGETVRATLPPATRVIARLRGRAVRSTVLEALGIVELAAQLPTHEIATAISE